MCLGNRLKHAETPVAHSSRREHNKAANLVTANAFTHAASIAPSTKHSASSAVLLVNSLYRTAILGKPVVLTIPRADAKCFGEDTDRLARWLDCKASTLATPGRSRAFERLDAET
jgi:hypothetical protein